MDSGPLLPPKFPCWCRAIYSWGGETKKDLGFIEGDLIECLNAGDGQWWTGRLRRDKRAVGMFPSNFVKVLEEGFKPVSRGTSPQTSAETTPAPKKEKSIFRKPFQAYSEYVPEQKKAEVPAAKPIRPISRGHERHGSGQRIAKPSRVHQLRDTPSRQDSSRSYVSDATYQNFSSPNSSRIGHRENPNHQAQAHDRRQSYQSYEDTPSRQNSYQQRGAWNLQQSQYQRTPSEEYSHHRQDGHYDQDQSLQSRRNSYAPRPQQYDQQMACHSHTPSAEYTHEPPPPPPQHHYSESSPVPDSDDEAPPPPPPAHRTPYNTHASRAPSPTMNDRYPAMSRTPSPMPHSPNPGMTPSPLREAMTDVLDSLQDMSTDMDTRQDDDSNGGEREPLNPWSPDAYEELRQTSRRKRPQSCVGVLAHADSSNGYSLHTDDSGYGSQIGSDTWKERMESRLRNFEGSHASNSNSDMPPPPPARRYGADADYSLSTPIDSNQRPGTSMTLHDDQNGSPRKLRSRKSAVELGKGLIGRTFTTKSSASNATQSTNAQSNASGQSNHTLMSGTSAGGFSATSAGSFARKKLGSLRRQNRPMSVAGTRPDDLDTSQLQTPSQASGPSYHSSHASQNSALRPLSAMEKPTWTSSLVNPGDQLGGLSNAAAPANPPQLKSKRSGFLRKLVDSAKAGAASARSTIASTSPDKESRRKSVIPNGITSISSERSAAEEMGLGGGPGEQQYRRDVNRSNSLSAIERQERRERCEIMNQPTLPAVQLLAEATEGEQGADGEPIARPTDFKTPNVTHIDKTARFVKDLPTTTNASSLASGYLCRPYRSDVQRLRSIFTWVSEMIAWEGDYEGEIDTRRVIHSRRGCPAEVSALVLELCQEVGIPAERVNGFLKAPGELIDVCRVPRPNHWWNAVLVDGEWRFMDCSLASLNHPKRPLYSMAPSRAADPWYFLMRPLEACYTHIPSHMAQQHLVPPVSPDILLALPCACPPFFKHGLSLVDYDTSLLFLSELEPMQIDLAVPSDVEVFAEVETSAYVRDTDGDSYESGDKVIKRALAQAHWVNGSKRYTIKAVLPEKEPHGKLNVFAGKRSLMHSTKENPHSLALSLPIIHTGKNPAFDFVLRHPTPHAMRHDLYVTSPQCFRLTVGQTYIFVVRQHPSSIPSAGTSSGLTSSSPAFGQSTSGALSPLPFRPGSSLSMISSNAGSNFGPIASTTYSDSSSSASNSNGATLATPGKEKPAKLAVQSPGGKIHRMSRRPGDVEGEFGGGSWEAFIKMTEKGTWRGLVLADRTARWCVFGEWECL